VRGLYGLNIDRETGAECKRGIEERGERQYVALSDNLHVENQNEDAEDAHHEHVT